MSGVIGANQSVGGYLTPPAPLTPLTPLYFAPSPVLDFGQVVAIFRDVQLVPLNLFRVPLLRLREVRCEPGHAADDVDRELEAIDIVEHAHVEGSGGGAFFLVTAHMQVVMVVPPVGKPVDAQRIAVKIKNRGDARRKDLN